MAKTDEEMLRKAFAALLDGDTAERDRLCDLVKHRQNQRIRAKEGGPSPVDLVLKGGIFIPAPPSDKIH